MSVTLYSAQVVGLDARPISVEVDIASGLHVFSIVGLADKEIQESRQRISAAIKNIGALAPHQKAQRVIVNMAPADIRKEGPAFDLPIALGYLLASKQITFEPQGKLFLGELGLDGKVRKVNGVLPIALAARLAGFSTLILPQRNGAEAAMVDGIQVIEVEDIAETIEYLAGRKDIHATLKDLSRPVIPQESNDLKDIRGQTLAKRALEIAAAGGHNLSLYGPPGTGKTILAKSLPSILPPLLTEESLEVSKIYSVAGLLSEEKPILSSPPFRNPHHTSSYTAVIGGGAYPRPGEITLAHRGVLFLDEFPEFDRRVMESLRQPLEEHCVTVARASGTHTFPAHFMLVTAMNPCPCGNFGNPDSRRDCVCTPGSVVKYRKKVSGPMLDRIDLHVEVPALSHAELEGDEGEPSAEVRSRVERARHIQKKRFYDASINTNSEMRLREIKRFIPLDPRLKPIMAMAHERHRLSARAYHKVLKISRTIADLEGSEEIKEAHLGEALQYRPKQEL